MSSFTFQERLNHWYLFVIYGALGFIGSGLSIAVIGTLGYSTMRFFLNRRYSYASMTIKLFAVAGVLYFLSGVAMYAGNMDDLQIGEVLIDRIPFLLMFPLFFQISISDRAVIKQYFGYGLLLSAIGIACWVIFGLISGSPRIAGGAGNAGPFATTCAFVFALCGLFAVSNNDKSSWLFVVAALFAAIGLLSSGMRLFYPFFIVVPVIIAGIYAKQMPSLFTRRNMVIAAFGVGGIVLLTFPFLDARISSLISNYSTFGFEPSATTSLGQRIALWECAVAGIPDAPIFGWGAPDAIDYMGKCSLDLVGSSLHFTHFHNFILTALMFGGVVESAAVLFLLFSVPCLLLWQSWRQENDGLQRFALAASLLTVSIYLLQGSVNLMLGHDIHDMLFIHANVLFLVLFHNSPKRAAYDEAKRTGRETGIA